MLGKTLAANIDTSTEAGSGILRITARSDRPGRRPRPPRAATAQAFTESIADNKLMVATLVDPRVARTRPCSRARR